MTLENAQIKDDIQKYKATVSKLKDIRVKKSAENDKLLSENQNLKTILSNLEKNAKEMNSMITANKEKYENEKADLMKFIKEQESKYQKLLVNNKEVMTQKQSMINEVKKFKIQCSNLKTDILNLNKQMLT